MAQKKESPYIQFYTSGNAARVLEPAPQKKVQLPEAPKPRRQVVHLDLTAACAIVMAVALLVTMVFGLVQMRNVRRERMAMEKYVLSLRNENVELNHEYHETVDLEKIETLALSQGMIPKDEAYRIPITISVPEEESTSLWHSIGVFFTGLFA